jgi:hypothetical protein
LQSLTLDRRSAAAWKALLDALHPVEPTLVFGVPTRCDELSLQALEALGYDNARGWGMLGQVIRCRKAWIAGCARGDGGRARVSDSSR